MRTSAIFPAFIFIGTILAAPQKEDVGIRALRAMTTKVEQSVIDAAKIRKHEFTGNGKQEVHNLLKDFRIFHIASPISAIIHNAPETCETKVDLYSRLGAAMAATVGDTAAIAQDDAMSQFGIELNNARREVLFYFNILSTHFPVKGEPPHHLGPLSNRILDACPDQSKNISMATDQITRAIEDIQDAYKQGLKTKGG